MREETTHSIHEINHPAQHSGGAHRSGGQDGKVEVRADEREAVLRVGLRGVSHRKSVFDLREEGGEE